LIQAYPLQWPPGWQRTASDQRKRAAFGKTETKHNTIGSSWQEKKRLSIEDAMKRVRGVLDRMRVDVANDMVVSTNLRLNLSGNPRGDQGEPVDPGAAVYWVERESRRPRVMAIDTYNRVADNIGAIAATLEAMRAIERYGGAEILDRAFSGFEALPAPKPWWEILGLRHKPSSRADVELAFRARARTLHPDMGGSDAAMAELNDARERALKEVM
jgi:hypothetical protein